MVLAPASSWWEILVLLVKEAARGVGAGLAELAVGSRREVAQCPAAAAAPCPDCRLGDKVTIEVTFVITIVISANILLGFVAGWACRGGRERRLRERVLSFKGKDDRRLLFNAA